MITPKIQQLVDKIEATQDALEEAVLEEIALEAQRQGFTKVDIRRTGNTYYIGEVCRYVCPAIQMLDELCMDYANASGFEASWTSEKGWV